MEGEVVVVVKLMEGEVKKWLMGVVVTGNWGSRVGELHREVIDKVTIEGEDSEGMEEEDRQGKAVEEEDNLGGNVWGGRVVGVARIDGGGGRVGGLDWMGRYSPEFCLFWILEVEESLLGFRRPPGPSISSSVSSVHRLNSALLSIDTPSVSASFPLFSCSTLS